MTDALRRMSAELIDLAGDTRLFRTFRLTHLREAIETSTMVLVPPNLWDDPFENLLEHVAITDLRQERPKQTFLANSRRPVYAQCWSLAEESDAQWRIYSTVRKDPATGRNLAVDDEGVRVRSTASSLLSALEHGATPTLDLSCFLGRVRHLPERDALQEIANDIGRRGGRAFTTAREHALSMLVKRQPFDHEREARLIAIANGPHRSDPALLHIAIRPSALFEEVILDPRLHPDDARAREADIRHLGYSGPIRRSALYQGTFVNMIVGS